MMPGVRTPALLSLIVWIGLSAGCQNVPPAGGNDLSGGGGQDLSGGGQDLRSAGDMTTVTPAQACAAFAMAFCNQLQTCDPHQLTLTYGDVATCVTREQINCPQRFSVAGTPGALQACADAYTGASCAEIFQNNPPMACRPGAGALSAGAVCGLSGQCAGSYCPIDPNTGCGKCAARVTQGGACGATEDCAYGLVCPVGGTATCSTTLAMGASCSVDIRCQWGMGCISGKCATYLTLGAACPTGTGCDVHQGLYCNAMKMCDTVKYAAGGQPCGALAAGMTQCKAGALCKIPTGGTTGTCVAPVTDGGMCSADLTVFKQCMQPAGCEGGTCKVPDPALCH